MNLWTYLDRKAERRAKREGLDFRGWLAIALFAQTTFLFTLIALVKELRENQGFLTLASAVIVTGWIGGAVAFAYAAGKSDDVKAANTGKFADAITAVAQATGAGDQAGAASGAREVADAAEEKASKIEGEAP